MLEKDIEKRLQSLEVAISEFDKFLGENEEINVDTNAQTLNINPDHLLAKEFHSLKAKNLILKSVCERYKRKADTLSELAKSGMLPKELMSKMEDL